MKYPCYKIKNEREFKYIRTYLNSFGYITDVLIYYPGCDYIVLNSCGKFERVDNVSNPGINRFNRYKITNINDFLSIAAKLKNATFKPNKNKTNMENNKSQAKEPKAGDKVLVKNNRDEYFQTRIYIGKIHNKNACVSKGFENEFNQNKPVVLSFWDEMITELKLTKTQIAERFGVPVNMLEIVD